VAFRRWLRLFGVALAASLIAALVALLWGRLLMWAVAEMAPGRHGDVTHESAVVGQRTLSGTLKLLSNAPFFAIPGAIVYLILRRWVPGRGAVKGLVFGVFILLMFGDSILDGDYEYFRYVSPAITVPMFATVFPVYGAALASLAERWAGPSPWPPRRRVTIVGQVVLGALFIVGALHLRETLSSVYHLI
jgi:hypothetical protein